MLETLRASVLLVLAWPAAAQQLSPTTQPPNGVITIPAPTPPRRSWYSGDTHEHFQSCFGGLRSLEEILTRMEAEHLDLVHLLVWGATGGSYQHFCCLVTDVPDTHTLPGHMLQVGVETSGLDCDKWGHMIGLGIGPDQARIAQGSVDSGACSDMPGLGLGCPGGDGTGVLAAPVAAHFYTAPGAVCGYAHSVWTLGLYHPEGYDWQGELVPDGFAADIECLDTRRLLAFPNLDRLFGRAEDDMLMHGSLLTAFFPLFGAVDAVLGDVQFFETTALTTDFPVLYNPPAHWFGLYDKLLNCGLRVGLSGGSDSACPLPGVTEFPRTYVWLDEPFSFDAWTHGLVAGRTSLGVSGLRIGLALDGSMPGEELDLTPARPRADAEVEIESGAALDDVVELLVDGDVRASLPVVLLHPGRTTVLFEGVPFLESTWVAARLASKRASTAAVYVIVDNRPIADCSSAEYWMVWCDVLTQAVRQRPELGLFGCQEAEALERIARGRRAFKSYRDIESFDPAFTATRFGDSTPACRGPIAIGTAGPLTSEASTIVTCLNAPPEAEGRLILSRVRLAQPQCIRGASMLVDALGPGLLAEYPVHSTRSGYAEVEVPGEVHDRSRIYGQFVFTNPPGCAAAGCGTGPALVSASDGIEWKVQGIIRFDG